MREKKVLDYGCGLGGNYTFIAKKGAYFGVDILETNITYAKNRYTKGRFYLTNGRKLPFRSDYFDEVHAYDVLEHVEDMGVVLYEINRVLKKGGKFFVVVPAHVSEKKMLKLKPSYFEDVGHVRIVDPDNLTSRLKKENYIRVFMKKIRGMEALVYVVLFWKNKDRRYMDHQTGSPSFSKILVAFIWIFDSRLFITPLKYLFFVYMFTLPIGWVISQVFPKSIYMVFKKI